MSRKRALVRGIDRAPQKYADTQARSSSLRKRRFREYKKQL